MILKGVTLAEKLRLAQEAGVTLPHYTNTENPVDFPKSENNMNERIRQLSEQAHRSTRDELVHLERVHNRMYDLNESAVIYNEKFAELIVRECIDIIAPYSVRMSRPGEEYLHPIQEIKKHFGVEE